MLQSWDSTPLDGACRSWLDEYSEMLPFAWLHLLVPTRTGISNAQNNEHITRPVESLHKQ